MSKGDLVFVGLSGGVDSSVAALRLKQAGYRVVGVFIRVWHPDFITCTEEQDRIDAMRVAAQLEIPFLTCDAREAYKAGVADEMIREYQAGRTPNPDVLCNKVIKFGVFESFAKKHGAQMLATGHYAQRTGAGDDARLIVASDAKKDQTYFLWMIERALLAGVLFPIGDTLKGDVRSEAFHAGLSSASRPDSQGLCFLGKVDMKDFLSHYVTSEPGVVRDTSGKKIGTHDGALFYTIGQRHGIHTATAIDSTSPLYVVKKNISENELIVSQERPVLNIGAKFALSSINLLIPGALEEGSEYHVVTRYHGPRVRAHIATVAGTTIVTLIGTGEAISDGQSCVIYDSTTCIGGGIIEPYYE